MSFYVRSAAELASFGCHLASNACLVYSGLILGNTRAKCSGAFFCAVQEPITEMKVAAIWVAAYIFHEASTWLDNCFKERNVAVMHTRTAAAQNVSDVSLRQVHRVERPE